jgi:NADPH2:quinone reductase
MKGKIHKMKAIVIREFGGPEVLRIDDVPLPEPREGQVRIKIHAVGVNFTDTVLRRGDRSAEPPVIPGIEAAGFVDAMGPDVSNVEIGDRVAFCLSPGTYAQFAVAPDFKAMPIPEGLDMNIAAGAMTTGLTAHYLTQTTHPVHSGETVLVHAAASGTGLMIVQMAKRRGATVIGTTSTQEKASVAIEAGADHIILYTKTNFEEEVRRLTGEQGVHVVYDPVGKATFEKSLSIIRQRGDMVLFGHASGSVASFEPHLLNRCGSLKLTYPSLWHHATTPEEYRARASDVLSWVKSGEITVHIDRVLPLDEAPQAHRLLIDRQVIGKLILQPEH